MEYKRIQIDHLVVNGERAGILVDMTVPRDGFFLVTRDTTGKTLQEIHIPLKEVPPHVSAER